MSVITTIPTTRERHDVVEPEAGLAPVLDLDAHRRPAADDVLEAHEAHEALPMSGLAETGAASAEYAAVTACGVGLAGVLMKLLSSDFGQSLLENILKFFLKMVGIG